jgi:hypothetical protein
MVPHLVHTIRGPNEDTVQRPEDIALVEASPECRRIAARERDWHHLDTFPDASQRFRRGA